MEIGFDAYLQSTNGNPLTYDTVRVAGRVLSLGTSIYVDGAAEAPHETFALAARNSYLQATATMSSGSSWLNRSLHVLDIAFHRFGEA